MAVFTRRSEFSLLLDELAATQAEREAAVLRKAAQDADDIVAQMQRSFAESAVARRQDAVRAAASRARLDATLADLQALARSGAQAAAAVQRAQLRGLVAGLLAKAAEASRNGRLTAHQVAVIEAKTHRLTAGIGL